MMGFQEEAQTAEEDQAMISADPSTDPSNPLTYDPTQGRGTDGWQAALARQRALNEKLGANAQLRRN